MATPSPSSISTTFRSAFGGRRVLVTGHTGFKGSWLSLWLHELGAKVFGYALDPSSTPSMFELARIGEILDDVRADIRDLDRLSARVAEAAPELVFHLAAQPIVRASYDDPVGTMGTNVMGTVHVLEAVRRYANACGRPCHVVIVTTDKVYEETDGYACRETDPLGGADPYSASKACAEIVTSSYARSYFGETSSVRVASARAGNVIGGGDYAADRLIPDLVRSIMADAPLVLRHPGSVRPWQHVLEPLSGYLWLGARLADASEGRRFTEAFNFGPSSEGFRTVLEIAEHSSKVIRRGAPSKIEIGAVDPSRHEMPSLTLSTDKARRRLAWSPVWAIDRAVEETMTWYRAVGLDGADARTQTKQQIHAYVEDARKERLAWALAVGSEAT